MIRLIFVAIAAISICNGCTEKQLQQTLRDPGAIPSGTEISGRYSLVEIASMDDSIYTPGPGSRYILDFQQDNELVIIDDCNHGQANWTVTPPRTSQLDSHCPIGADHRYGDHHECVVPHFCRTR